MRHHGHVRADHAARGCGHPPPDGAPLCSQPAWAAAGLNRRAPLLLCRHRAKNGELLEPHLWTNQIEQGITSPKDPKSKSSLEKLLKGARPPPLLFTNSLRQYGRHRGELLSQRRIAGDASADLMYRVAVPRLPTSNLVHALQPDAKLIAVLRDPVARTWSDFRFFFHCATGPDHYQMCPAWWPHVSSRPRDRDEGVCA